MTSAAAARLGLTIAAIGTGRADLVVFDPARALQRHLRRAAPFPERDRPGDRRRARSWWKTGRAPSATAAGRVLRRGGAA